MGFVSTMQQPCSFQRPLLLRVLLLLLLRSVTGKPTDHKGSTYFESNDETSSSASFSDRRRSLRGFDPKTVQRKAITRQSIIQWCEGDEAVKGQCPAKALQRLIVTSDKDSMLSQLKYAMQSRRLLTDDEHHVLADRFRGISIGGQVFERVSSENDSTSLVNRSAYHYYALYAHTMLQFQQQDMLSAASSKRKRKPLWLEMGVYKGSSCNLTASLLGNDVKIHGFDTFTGLPQAWRGLFGRGYFSLEGKLPPVASSVRLHKGLFNETLPKFLQRYDSTTTTIAGLNIDCDLYQGARETLELTWRYWRPGVTLLHFHELHQEAIVSKLFSTPHQEEAAALIDFLQAHPGVVLKLIPVASSFCEPAVLQVVDLPRRK